MESRRNYHILVPKVPHRKIKTDPNTLMPQLTFTHFIFAQGQFVSDKSLKCTLKNKCFECSRTLIFCELCGGEAVKETARMRMMGIACRLWKY